MCIYIYIYIYIHMYICCSVSLSLSLSLYIYIYILFVYIDLSIYNQSSVAMAWKEFDDDGRMKESSFRDRVVDVMEEFRRLCIYIYI